MEKDWVSRWAKRKDVPREKHSVTHSESRSEKDFHAFGKTKKHTRIRKPEGDELGTTEGAMLGERVGMFEGTSMGDKEGEMVGFPVG